MRISSRPVILTLGSLGLIPFAFLMVIHLTGWLRSDIHAQSIFITYSAIILSFIAGATWGQVLEQPSQSRGKSLLITSNLIALLAWLGLLIEQPHLSLLALLAGYVSVYWLETRWLRQMRPDHSYYPNMRFLLTILVSAMHLLMLYPKI